MKVKAFMFTLALILSFSFANVSEAASSAYNNAVAKGKDLNVMLTDFNKTIDNGNIYKINGKYDRFSNQIKATEIAIGKVSGKSTRDKLFAQYVKPSKIARERVIYEVSQYRLLHKTGKMAINSDPKVQSNLDMLGRLKKRAVEIKQAGGYEPVSATIAKVLNGTEGLLRNNKFVRIDPNAIHAINSYEYELFILLNFERFKANVAGVTLDEKLSYVSRVKSNDMKSNKSLSINSPKYGTPQEMLEEFNIQYTEAGINIFGGYPDASALIEDAMSDSFQKKQLLKADFTHTGLGYVAAPGQYYRTYWTGFFTQ